VRVVAGGFRPTENEEEVVGGEETERHLRRPGRAPGAGSGRGRRAAATRGDAPGDRNGAKSIASPARAATPCARSRASPVSRVLRVWPAS
jgi:hypothetical protein